MQSCGNSDPHLSGSNRNSCVNEWHDRGREGGMCNTAPGEPNAQTWGRVAAVFRKDELIQTRKGAWA